MKSGKKINDFLNLLKIERVLIFTLFIISVFIGFHYASAPKYWDDLLYINTAWNMDKLATIENRYTTIFLLSIFNFFAKGDPLVGARIFGAFTFSTISLLVYMNARLIAKINKIIIGSLAVIMMLTYTVFVKDLGIVMADYTVTLMMLLGVLIYLLYLRTNSQKKVFLILFGFILSLAFKSKETGLILGILIPGFLLDFEPPSHIKDIFKKLGVIFIGVLIGALLFIFLNNILLGDAFFGLRASDINEYIGFNTRNSLGGQNLINNYLGFVFPNSMFFISLIYFLRSDSQAIRKTKWIWLMAMGIVAFLNLTLINGELDTVYPRYLTPAIAVLAILSPQILSLGIDNFTLNKKTNFYAILGGLILGLTGTFLLYFFVGKKLHWTFEHLMYGVLIPLVSCILLVWIVFNRKINFYYLFILAALIGTITIPNAVHNLYQLTSNDSQQESRFLPFQPFSQMINCDADKILVSGSIHLRKDLFARDVFSAKWMYNLYFRCHKTNDDFTYENDQDKLYKDLLMNEYDYVFLDKKDIDFLLNQASKSQDIFSKYTLLRDTSGIYYLLSSYQ
jgi:hypothetical protein